MNNISYNNKHYLILKTIDLYESHIYFTELANDLYIFQKKDKLILLFSIQKGTYFNIDLIQLKIIEHFKLFKKLFIIHFENIENQINKQYYIYFEFDKYIYYICNNYIVNQNYFIYKHLIDYKYDTLLEKENYHIKEKIEENFDFKDLSNNKLICRNIENNSVNFFNPFDNHHIYIDIEEIHTFYINIKDLKNKNFDIKYYNYGDFVLEFIWLNKMKVEFQFNIYIIIKNKLNSFDVIKNKLIFNVPDEKLNLFLNKNEKKVKTGKIKDIKKKGPKVSKQSKLIQNLTEYWNIPSK